MENNLNLLNISNNSKILKQGSLSHRLSKIQINIDKNTDEKVRRASSINDILYTNNITGSNPMQINKFVTTITKINSDIIDNMPYLTAQSMQSVEADKKLALQEALLVNVEKKAYKYNKYKLDLDDKENIWRNVNNEKQNTEGKLINKRKL